MVVILISVVKCKKNLLKLKKKKESGKNLKRYEDNRSTEDKKSRRKAETQPAHGKASVRQQQKLKKPGPNQMGGYIGDQCGI